MSHRARPGARPHRLVAVLGTGTDIGKTWIAARLLTQLRAAGVTVAARKPAQSFDPSDDPASLDAAVLGCASGEAPEIVCPPHRWYETAMAPPMAADALGRPGFSIADLTDELSWPDDPVDVGLLETAGGVRSPIADDGDCLDLVLALEPDLALLVADAGLGTINSVRLAVAALTALTALTALQAELPVVVALNRFEPANDLHQRNLDWLRRRDDLIVVTSAEEDRLASRVRGDA